MVKLLSCASSKFSHGSQVLNNQKRHIFASKIFSTVCVLNLSIPEYCIENKSTNSSIPWLSSDTQKLGMIHASNVAKCSTRNTLYLETVYFWILSGTETSCSMSHWGEHSSIPWLLSGTQKLAMIHASNVAKCSTRNTLYLETVYFWILSGTGTSYSSDIIQLSTYCYLVTHWRGHQQGTLCLSDVIIIKIEIMKAMKWRR